MNETFSNDWTVVSCIKATTKMLCYKLIGNIIAQKTCKKYNTWIKNIGGEGAKKCLYCIVELAEVTTKLPFVINKKTFSIPGYIRYVGKGRYIFDKDQRIECRGSQHYNDEVYELVRQNPEKYAVYIILDTIIEEAAVKIESYMISWTLHELYPNIYEKLGYTKKCLNQVEPTPKNLGENFFKTRLTYDYNKTRQE